MTAGQGTFGGLTFWVREAGELARADIPRRSVTAERLSVGGGRRVRQVLGYESPELALTLELASVANLNTLRGLVGTSGTLTVDGGSTITYSGYYLDRVDSVTVDDTNGLAFCTAIWKGA
jgi:hypothetical protein